MDQSHENKAQRLARLGYILLFLGVLFGFTALAGAIISHSRLGETHGTVARSHLILQLWTFWSILAIAVCTFFFAGHTINASLIASAAAIWLTTLIYGTTLFIRQLPVPLFSSTH